jgi:hypothetical protein
MRIGEIAAGAEVNIQTLRRPHREGAWPLVPASHRLPAHRARS